MTDKTIKIDQKTGHIFLGKLEITQKTKPSDLSDEFATTEEFSVSVGREKIPCIFSKINFQHNGLHFKLTLRFECRILVRIFIEINDPSAPASIQKNFWKSIESARNLHEHWLKDQFGDTLKSHSRFKWGVVGISQDKSDNICIYLNYTDNP